MSKKLIAGAGVVASLAVALAPLATFADNVTSHVDTLRLNIQEVCTLGTVTAGVSDSGTDATTHTGSTWTPGTASGTTGKTDVYAADVAPGQTYAAFATSVFTVKCNNAGGYQLKAAGPASGNLTTGTYNIPTGTGANADLTADDNSYWNFAFAVSNAYDASGNAKGQEIASGYNSAAAVPTSATTVVTGHGAMSVKDGETITVTYNAGIDAFQEAGTYEGSITYTLVAAN